jgi:S-DNA-T family DNA segregation ATPase FtsK/SpoIIIE
MGTGMAHVTRDFLKFQSERLERAMPVHVERAQVVDGWIRFDLTAAPGARLPAPRMLRHEAAAALGADDVHFTKAGEAFALEVPRPDVPPIHLLALLDNLSAIPPLTACLGLASDGRPLLIRLPSREVGNVLVTGGAGAGKTELMRVLLLSLALANRQSQLQLALIDSRAHGLALLAGLPHLLAPAAASPAGAEALLDRLVAEIERREAARVTAPHIVAAIDDFPELLGVSGRNAKALLTHIVQRGREAGVSLVAGARPSPGLGSLPRADFPVRLAGRVDNADQAREASGLSGSGAERLAGHGSFIAVANGQPIPFKAAWLPPGDWPALVARLDNPATLHA